MGYCQSRGLSPNSYQVFFRLAANRNGYLSIRKLLAVVKPGV